MVAELFLSVTAIKPNSTESVGPSLNDLKINFQGEKNEYIVNRRCWLCGQRLPSLLKASGHHVVAFDNLVEGHADAVDGAALVVGDIRDTRCWRKHCATIRLKP